MISTSIIARRYETKGILIVIAYTADLKPFFSEPEIKIATQLECSNTRWHLTYIISGKVNKLKLRPSALLPERKENLWQGSCCELFIQDGISKQYIEWNFCFSSHWDASEFLDYRKKDTHQLDTKPPSILKEIEQGKITLKASFPAPPLHYEQVRTGITVILEDQDGKLNYWALNHPKPDQKPDFHDFRSFCLNIDTTISGAQASQGQGL